MPTRPPNLRTRKVPAERNLSNWTKRTTRQARGYGREHDLMRKRILIEEPLCRLCLREGRVTVTVIADHIVGKAEGGTDERDNYQGMCRTHHTAKTARESARGRERNRG